MQTDIRHIIILLTVFVLVSCGHENSNRNSQTTVDTVTTINQNLTRANSTDVIDFPCAIILSPTNKTIDSLKKADGEDFYTAADDIMFYTSAATKYFDSLKIKTIAKASEGMIKFHMTNGKDTALNLNSFYWDIFLFNGKDVPRHMGRADFDMEVDSYMFTK